MAYAKRHGLTGYAHKVVAHLAKRLFEMERLFEWVSGYHDLIRGATASNWVSRALARAEVSPNALYLALLRPELIEIGNPQQHAALNVAILTEQLPTGDPARPYKRMRSKHQLLDGEYGNYDLCLGRDDLGFIVQALFWMWREHSGQKKPNAVDMSLIYRLALNFLARIDPHRAERHLLQRMRGADYNAARAELGVHGLPDMFGFNGQKKLLPACNAILGDPVCIFCSNFVSKIIVEECDRETRGLRNRQLNPLLRAGFCPDAWDEPIGKEALHDAWVRAHDPLRHLDRGYAHPTLKPTQLKQAFRYVLAICEMPVPPMTDQMFGRHLFVPSGRLDVFRPEP